MIKKIMNVFGLFKKITTLTCGDRDSKEKID